MKLKPECHARTKNVRKHAIYLTFVKQFGVLGSGSDDVIIHVSFEFLYI